jgi:hypothetical protein
MVSTKRISGIPLSVWFSREFDIVTFDEFINALDSIKHKSSTLSKYKRELLIDTLNLICSEKVYTTSDILLYRI